ncbi:MAG: zinc-ribbon domain-containing protein [Candidatus Hodarchaeota archaeon]
MKNNLKDKFKICSKCKKFFPKDSKYCTHCESHKIIAQMEKELKEKPPFGIKPFVIGHHYYKYGRSEPIIKYYPSVEYMFNTKTDSKIFNKVRLDKSLENHESIDLDKFKKCPKCKKYVPNDSKFCIHCGAEL